MERAVGVDARAVAQPGVVGDVDAVEVALQDQNVIDSMADLGTTPSPAEDVTPDAHTAKLQEQIDLWTPIIEESGVTGG